MMIVSLTRRELSHYVQTNKKNIKNILIKENEWKWKKLVISQVNAIVDLIK